LKKALGAPSGFTGTRLPGGAAKSLSSSAFIRGIPVETDRGRTQFQSDLPVAACGDDLKKINRESALRLVQRLKVA
jgi:hypothetical protein